MARRSNIGRAIARAGGYGKKVKRKKAGKKKAGKKRAKKRSSKKSGKKRSSKKRSSVNRSKKKRSVRQNKPRKKGAKKRGTTTTFKASGLRIKTKCGPGKAAVARAAKARIGNKTYVVIGSRCVPIFTPKK